MTLSVPRLVIASFLLPAVVVVGADAAATCPLAAAMSGPADDPAHAHHEGAAPKVDTGRPAELGQGAFAAVAEMVRLLDADPEVDWSRVDLDAFREHLIDMDRVMTRAEVDVTLLPDGFRARVRSDDPRTASAVDAMLPMHGSVLDGHRGWRVEVRGTAEEEGFTVTVRADDPAEAARLRALGFAGFLVAGDHHGPHHLMMSRGSGH